MKGFGLGHSVILLLETTWRSSRGVDVRVLVRSVIHNITAALSALRLLYHPIMMLLWRGLEPRWRLLRSLQPPSTVAHQVPL